MEASVGGDPEQLRSQVRRLSRSLSGWNCRDTSSASLTPGIHSTALRVQVLRASGALGCLQPEWSTDLNSIQSVCIKAVQGWRRGCTYLQKARAKFLARTPTG